MAADPAKMIVIRNFLVEHVADRLAAFMAEDAEFTLEHGLYSSDEGVTADRWAAAPESDRFFRFGKLAGTKPEAMLSDNALTYMRFRSFVTERSFHDFFQGLTGLELGTSDDFGLHAFGVGDFLLDHDDANKNRRVALVMYLTPRWRPQYGGALFMDDAQGNERRTDAEFNSMAVFDTLAGTKHHVGVVEEAAGDRQRRTFGGWFPNPS